MPKKDEAAFRWNWDAPLVISSHNNHRLYFAANKVFKSDDQGNTWTTISGDLTRKLDRNQMEVMGEIQKPEVVMKNKSTTIFGNIVALTESPKDDQIIYAGTDDGLIQITTDGGANWTKKETLSGIPSMTYVNMLLASQHDQNKVYAVFNNHKQGDFKPYIMKSTNKGDSWTSITGNLPERGSVYAIAEDHVNSDLLFAGTEFGVFFTIDGGINWIQLESGLPTVAIRDIAIQTRENDLVLASFGRGFYILDDYSTLRELTPENLNKEAHIFPIKTALEYVPSSPLGLRGRGHQGESFYLGQNPTFGVTIRYHIKASTLSAKETRIKANEDGTQKYPTNDEFFFEDNEESAFLLFIIKDNNGKEVRKIKTGANAGMNSVTWNLRYPTTSPITLSPSKPGRYSDADEGPLALPGTYSVSFYLCNNGAVNKIGNKQSFEVKALENSSLSRQTKENIAFKTKLSELRRQFNGSYKKLNDLSNRVEYIKAAIQTYPNASLDWLEEVKQLELSIKRTYDLMWGASHLSKRDIETLPGIGGRIETIVYQSWYSTSNPTTTNLEQYQIALDEYASIKLTLLKISNTVIALEEKLNTQGIPYTPNRENFRSE
jgi:photosystem II stability/assembly factor-like uncharacterized protein